VLDFGALVRMISTPLRWVLTSARPTLKVHNSIWSLISMNIRPLHDRPWWNLIHR